MSHDQEVPGSRPVRVRNFFSIRSMDDMINGPMACLTMNRVQKSDGQTKNKHSKQNKCKTGERSKANTSGPWFDSRPPLASSKVGK